MKKMDIIESLGYLLKEETLQTVDHFVLQNTLVLENMEPFPGYHGENLPQDTAPDSVFLITDKKYPTENILRISEQMRGYAKIHFDACPAEIFIYNTQLFAIRIRGLNNYSLIADIQSWYIDHGFKFNKKRSINDPGLIRIHKVFSMERMDEHLFHDLEVESTFYMAIPYHLNWSLFKRVTKNIKNNLESSNFDCALGFIYLKNILEFVRVYTPHLDLRQLKLIREKYLEEIARLQEK